MPGVEFSFKPSPDWTRLARCLRLDGEPDRVPFFELFANQPIMDAVIGRQFPGRTSDPEAARLRAAGLAEFHLKTGYDYLGDGTLFSFPRRERAASQDGRTYVNTEVNTIPDRAAFEAYEWPAVRDEHFLPVEAALEALPEGMKMKPLGPGGVLENVMWLMGYEPLSYALVDDEKLVEEMFTRIGTTLVDIFTRLAGFENTEFINLGDDMGFKTQTMLPPDLMRKYVFPWQKKIVDAVHAQGKIAVLHACGNLTDVMDDIIACGWEAKHSFEDVIMPVAEAKRRWGERIAMCGGLDVDKICRFSPEEVREYTRGMIRDCAPGGGWCLGTGNSVADYVPVANYVAMLEAGREFGSYPVA